MALTRVSPGVYRNANGGLVRGNRQPAQNNTTQAPTTTTTPAAPEFGNYLQANGFQQQNDGTFKGPNGRIRTADQLNSTKWGRNYNRDQSMAGAGHSGDWGGAPGWQINNPSGAIGAQQGYNEWMMNEQGQYNRPDEFNPYGSNSYTQNPDGSWTQRQELNPYEQEKLDQDRSRDIDLGNLAKALGGGLGQSFGQPYDISKLGNDPSKVDFTGERKRLEDQISGRFEELNGKRFNDDKESLKSRLLNSGITMGSELYNNQMSEMDRQQQDERRAAQIDAMRMGGSEMQRSYDMSQDARSRAIGEYDTQRNSAYNDLAKVLGIRGGVNNPNFQPRSDINVPGMDIPGTALGYAQFREQQKQNKFNNKFAMRNYGGRGGRSGRGGGGGGEDTNYDVSTDPRFMYWKAQQDYAKQNGPSSWDKYGGMVGSILGAGLGGWGQSGFEW